MVCFSPGLAKVAIGLYQFITSDLSQWIRKKRRVDGTVHRGRRAMGSVNIPGVHAALRVSRMHFIARNK